MSSGDNVGKLRVYKCLEGGRCIAYPKVITNDSKRPNGVLKAVFSISLGWICTLLYPHRMSNVVKNLAPSNLSTNLGIRGIGAAFFFVISFRGR